MSQTVPSRLFSTRLEKFFGRRGDLGRTLNSVIITHNHIDHTRALRRIVETFTVERYLDNGFDRGSGVGGPNWLKKAVFTTLSTAIQVVQDHAFTGSLLAGIGP